MLQLAAGQMKSHAGIWISLLVLLCSLNWHKVDDSGKNAINGNLHHFSIQKLNWMASVSTSNFLL